MSPARGGSSWGRRLGPLGLAVVTLGLGGVGARADRIALRGGAHLTGKVLPDPDHPERVAVLLERGKATLHFRKDQIVEVVPEPGLLDDYLARKAQAPATAEGQYDLGLWCERVKLVELAQAHYQGALDADKSFEPAHLKLRHVKRGDRWLVGDEIKEAQGLVKDRGRWVTKVEKERREQQDALAKEQAGWVRRLRQLREALETGTDDRRREAESQLMALREPQAVTPLVRVFGTDPAPARKVLARALGGIPGPEAALALVNGLINESDPDVRHTLLDEVGRRTEPEVSRQLTRALKSPVTEYVNRAAWAIAYLDLRPTVPSLVEALVTVREEMVLAPAPVNPAEGMSLSATFGAGPAVSAPGLTPAAYNGSTVGYLTGPTVGPGVVAYGGTSAPAYGSPNLNLNTGAADLAGVGINAGGGLNGSRGPIPQAVSVAIENTEVLAALVRLTGEDFGYDRAAWRRWVRASFQAEPVPARRVPQP